MKKVFFGGLKNHWKDYILVLICGIFMVTIIFLSNSLSDCLQWIIDGQTTGNAEESYSFFDFSITYLLLVFMMILIIFSYIRKRSYDYVLLDVMGIQKRHKYIFIGCEYLGIVVISILGGILFGAILSEIIKIELEKIFANIIFTEINYGFSPFRMTIIIGFCVFGLLFIVFDEAISCLGMDSLLSCGKKSGKPVKTRPKVFILGMTFMFLAYISLWFYWGKVSKGIPLILLSIGILLGMISIGAYYLCYLRKKENKYYKKITWLDNWYHRFFYNINMSFIITEFIIVTLYGFSIVIFDNIPVNEPQNYPYDVVWMASDKDIAFIDELKQKYEIKVKKQPCIRVTTTDQGEHMGISASAYEKWTKESLDLKDNEIYVVYQRERSERNYLGIDFGTKKPRIYMGEAKDDLWQYIAGVPMPSNKFDTSFNIVGEEEKILTGVFGNKISEHIIVFSDSYYQKVCNRVEGPNLIVMVQIPKNYEKVIEEICAYTNGSGIVYEKKNLLLQISKTKIINVSAAIINIFVLLICSFFVLSIKMECDFPEQKGKYIFYSQGGMTHRNINHALNLLQYIMAKLDLKLHPVKTKIVSMWDGKEGFDFLGMHHRRMTTETSKGQLYKETYQYPSRKAMKKMKVEIKRNVNSRSLLIAKEEDLIKNLNPKITGWKNYYSTKTNEKWMQALDWYIICTFTRWYNKKHQRRKHMSRVGFVRNSIYEKGLKKMARA